MSFGEKNYEKKVRTGVENIREKRNMNRKLKFEEYIVQNGRK
jgi:hypothetical protein